MNTKTMSYFSDIDLATLHQSRLNERIQYKLSWFNRRQKYYIPPTINHGDYQKSSIKSNANQKFIADHKKTNKSPNGARFISEKYSLASVNNSNRFTANPQRKNTCVNKSTLFSTRVNSINRNSNHCDNLTEDVSARINGIKIQKKCNQNNHITGSENNRINNALVDTHVSSSTIVLASASVKLDSVKTDDKPNAKCLSGDAINRNAQSEISDRPVNTHLACNETSTSDRQAIEDLDSIPHRKRSGTWP